MVGMDSTFIGLMLHPAAKPCDDPTTGKPPIRVGERVEKLLEDLDTARERIIIPTPCLCEFMVLAGKDAARYQSELHLNSSIMVKPFDELAASELAAIEISASGQRSK